MIELKYLDSYKVERTVNYEDIEEFLLAFSGCVTLADSFPVISLTYQNQPLPYQGTIGNLYRFMVNFDFSAYHKE